MTRPGPLTHAGRQTLVYLCLAGCGPVLTAMVFWALYTIRHWEGVNPIARLDKFASLTTYVAVALLIIVIALSCFVSIRAIKIGRDGIEAESNNNGSDMPPTMTATATVAVTSPAPPPPVDAPPPVG